MRTHVIAKMRIEQLQRIVTRDRRSLAISPRYKNAGDAVDRAFAELQSEGSIRHADEAKATV